MLIANIVEAQPHAKDKSAWRKSNLNVANSTEATKDDSSRHRHTAPAGFEACGNSHPFLDDDNERKSLISTLGERPATDKLTLYIRSPNDPESNQTVSNLGRVPRRIRDSQQSIESQGSNKVDIDQDNIETPPAIRRVFTATPVDRREPTVRSPCSRLTGRSKDTKVIKITAKSKCK